METATETSSERQEYLTFFLSGEEYGAPILKVREILRYAEPTVIPGTPSSIRGVINLRGKVLPILDLAIKFGMTREEVTPRTCIVVAEADWDGEEVLMGIVADKIHEVMEITDEEVEAVPAIQARADTRYLLGLAPRESEFALLLDMDRLLSADEFGITQEVMLESEIPQAAVETVPAP